MRIFQTKDYEILAALNLYVHRVHCAIYPDHFKEYDYVSIRDSFKQIVDSPLFIFLLLEHDSEYLGYAWIEIKQYIENPFMKAYKSVFVHQISISEMHRNQGYGSKLMEKIYEIAQLEGVNKIELDYWADNEMALNFYNKQVLKNTVNLCTRIYRTHELRFKIAAARSV